ncbi:MAG: SapC family protein [Thiovulaceae bacterium]|nr:SapC family protein [Sulfurimonadaceae bacterium]
MSRRSRVFIIDIPVHILLNSLDSFLLFKERSDYIEFTKIVQELQAKYRVKIHAYVLLPNCFEFLATPKDIDSLPKFMQSLGRRYVSYFNKKYERNGTILAGRYKASLVEENLYLFSVMNHIEQRASANYEFSSVGKNLFAKYDPIVTQHDLYKKFAYTDQERIKQYKTIFQKPLAQEETKFISMCLRKQLVTGSDSFIKKLEKITDTNLASKQRGRPKKQTSLTRKKMYKNLVVLDKEQHKELKLNPLENLKFATETTFIPVVANEVALVGLTFPVVFTADESPSVVALVSLGGTSLAINHEAKWVSSYVPSYLRKYPFSLVSTQENPEQKVVLIDDASELFSKGKGKKLFQKDGEPSETLQNAIQFLTAHDNQMQTTKNVAKIISASGILEEKEISVGEGEEKKVLVNGFKIINKKKLNALSDDILADWVRKGIITFIDAHLKSLENIQQLFNMAHKRQN